MRVRFCGLLVCLTAAVSAASAASTTLVISQVYDGGGNSGATIKNDFIEILNISGSPINLNGYSVQYASSAGSFTQVTSLPNVSLQPGHYFLIQEAAGAGGTVGLTPDATGSINMSGTAGKVALVNATAAIGSNCSAATIVDLLGYGGTGTPPSCFEGSSPGPLLSNTTAALRAGSGCTDTDNNGMDFSAGTPNPRNSSAAPANCTAGPSPIIITTTSLPPAIVNNIYCLSLGGLKPSPSGDGFQRVRAG